MLTTGSYATGALEPCQVLTEAALRDVSRVPWGSLVRVNCLGNAWKVIFDNRCTAQFF